MRQVVNLETGEIIFEEDAPVTPQTSEEIQVQINADAKAQLIELDAKSIRALREGDTKRLADLDKQAQALRDEFKSL